jgi:hypothetical protein
LNSDFIHFPIFIADDLKAGSTGIRKFFEDSKSLASIGCYYDEKNIVISIVCFYVCLGWFWVVAKSKLALGQNYSLAIVKMYIDIIP